MEEAAVVAVEIIVMVTVNLKFLTSIGLKFVWNLSKKTFIRNIQMLAVILNQTFRIIGMTLKLQ